jgi:hypothetical protein
MKERVRKRGGSEGEAAESLEERWVQTPVKLKRISESRAPKINLFSLSLFLL